MSGPSVIQALRERFESIRRSELQRLDKKLRALNDEDRRSVEAITADVIGAFARLPEGALANDAPRTTLEAVVQLFALTEGPSDARQQ